MSETFKEVLTSFRKDLKNSFQAQKNIVDVTERYLNKLEDAYEGGSGAGGINYSETEQDTGIKWIDGKAIYQRTFEFTTPSGSSYVAISNDTISGSYIALKSFMLELPSYQANYITATPVAYRLNTSSHKIECSVSDNAFRGVKAYATFIYTKS